ncbi:MAG: MotA/TolQ/ExbB proton channel family protein [Rhodovarius sp.]|nr:MotA/TolQ/ExbB proton channel family protein [Rhodovarius sp.]MDW8314300.1 MotA/TolQ/ExbB proton channel family protein [Rhodovarius sp.]
MTDPLQSPSPDLSIIGLFLMADWVVRSVMLLLLAASLAVWAVILDRSVRIAALRRDVEALLRHATAGQALPARHGWAALLAEMDRAWRAAADAPAGERRERAERAARLALDDRLRSLRRGLPLLASVASAAPFVGLFGTVWGVMNAFSGIARSGNTSLVAVAPGIAEALLATALGLLAAIPAALSYNRLAASLAEARGVAVSAAARLAFADRPPLEPRLAAE